MAYSAFIQRLLGQGARILPTTVQQQDDGPGSLSLDYLEMLPKWKMIEDILKGAEAVRCAAECYLPKYNKESRQSYDRRRRYATWRPEFEDCLRSLCSKPFTHPIVLQGEVPSQMAAFADDCDGQGNNLTVFAKRVFTDAVAKGFSGILVDYTRTGNVVNGRPATLADERALGARPYFVHVKAENVIAMYSEWVGGSLVVTHLRIRECVVVREGFKETVVERVREFEPGSWKLWQKAEKNEWIVIDGGPLTIPVIPFVPIFLGERNGTSYAVKPPLLDLAEMQMELYRAYDRLNDILTNAAAPMLVGKGIKAPEQRRDASGGVIEEDAVDVGPRQILFAPMNADGQFGDWAYCQPDAALITEVRKGVEAVAEDFQRLAMAPTIRKTGDVTATASAIDASKAHSACEAWAGILQDRLNEAISLVALWLSLPDTTTVSVSTDFHGSASGVDEAKVLASAQTRQVISKKAEVAELQRRNILGPAFDPDADEQQIAEETEGLEPEQPIDPVTGQLLEYPREVA